MQKGAANVAEIGTAACKSRAASNARDDVLGRLRRVTEGAMVKRARGDRAAEVGVGNLCTE
jgi:hypothetical protein